MDGVTGWYTFRGAAQVPFAWIDTAEGQHYGAEAATVGDAMQAVVQFFGLPGRIVWRYWPQGGCSWMG